MFKTRVTELLGIEHPIIAGTMGAGLSKAELVAAEANAGILGILPSATFPSKEEFRDEIRKVKSLTDKPFAVNINLFPMLVPIAIDDYIDTALEEGIKIMETSGRSPAPYAERIKSGGCVFIHKCARVRDARTAERAGADLIEIVGFECGGHPSMEEVTTLILLPQTVDAVHVPVIGGGGFADARGFIACLSLGAEGVLMGTRFMVTKECMIHDNFKNAFVEAPETATMIAMKSLGEPARVLRNQAADKVVEMEKQGTTLEDLISLISGAEGRDAMAKGDLDRGMMACGQVVGLIHDIPTVKEAVDNIINGAIAILERLPRP